MIKPNISFKCIIDMIPGASQISPLDYNMMHWFEVIDNLLPLGY